MNDLILDDWCEALKPYPTYAINMACRHWMQGDQRQKKPQTGDIERWAKVFGRKFLELEKHLTNSEIGR